MDLFAWDKSIYPTVGVAVSGGVDSMCLLHAFVSMGQNVVALHVEHGIRGEDSLADMRLVEDYCRTLGVPCLSTRVDAPALAEQRRIGLETAARTLRYRFFRQVLDEGKADVVATAHHLDDQAETVLTHLLRGSGLQGLTGIRDREGYVRPLLGVSREDIVRYAKEHGVPYSEDATNLDTDYTRNWLRHDLLPQVETRYPGYRQALSRLSKAAKEQVDLLNEIAIRPTRELLGMSLPLDALYQPSALAKWSIRLSIKPLSGAIDLEDKHYQAILALKDKPNGTGFDLAQKVRCKKEERAVWFWKVVPQVDIPFAEGTHVFGRYRIVVRPHLDSDPYYFDLDKIPQGARIRTRAAGDYIRKFGGGTKSLGDYYTDRKLGYPMREMPVVAIDDQVLICPADISKTVATDRNTTRVYTMIWEEI